MAIKKASSNEENKQKSKQRATLLKHMFLGDSDQILRSHKLAFQELQAQRKQSEESMLGSQPTSGRSYVRDESYDLYHAHPVVLYESGTNYCVGYWDSVDLAAEELNIKPQTITCYLAGQTKKLKLGHFVSTKHKPAVVMSRAERMKRNEQDALRSKRLEDLPAKTTLNDNPMPRCPKHLLTMVAGKCVACSNKLRNDVKISLAPIDATGVVPGINPFWPTRKNNKPSVAPKKATPQKRYVGQIAVHKKKTGEFVGIYQDDFECALVFSIASSAIQRCLSGNSSTRGLCFRKYSKSNGSAK